MDTRPLLEEKHALLKKELNGNLQKRLALELEISKEFEQLRRIEMSMEKGRQMTGTEKE